MPYGKVKSRDFGTFGVWVLVVAPAEIGNVQIYAYQLDGGDHVELMVHASEHDIEVPER